MSDHWAVKSTHACFVQMRAIVEVRDVISYCAPDDMLKLSDQRSMSLTPSTMPQEVDLSNNRLSGTVSNFASFCLDLRELNLSNNSLSGPLPRLYSQARMKVGLQGSVTHQPSSHHVVLLVSAC